MVEEPRTQGNQRSSHNKNNNAIKFCSTGLAFSFVFLFLSKHELSVTLLINNTWGELIFRKIVSRH